MLRGRDSDAHLPSAVAIEQLQNVLRRQLCGVSGFQFRQLLPAGIDPEGTHFRRMAASQRRIHGAMVLAVRDGSSRTPLHAMGRLVGERVPDLSRRSVRATDHKRVAAWVIEPLQSPLGAIPLNDANASPREPVAQNINGLPGRRPHRDGSEQRQKEAGKQTPATSDQRLVQM